MKKGNNRLFFNNIDSMSCQCITLSQFYNDDTLNIFSDASMMTDKSTNISYGCYGAVCVIKDTIIDMQYFVRSNTTVNECEISGIKLALAFADKYKYQFKFINIFSDSLISVKGLKEYIYNWKLDKKTNQLISSTGSVVANQNIFIEAYEMYVNLLFFNPNIRIWHQSGHIDDRTKSITSAAIKFGQFNKFNGSIDLNFIKYISNYNNFIDRTTREYLYKYDRSMCSSFPILFYPSRAY